jgi:hypothetical protein
VILSWLTHRQEATFWRRPWGNCIGSGLLTLYLTRKRLSRHVSTYMYWLADRVPSQKIQRWFYNHSPAPHRRTSKFIRRWSARNVFYHDKRPEIMGLAEKMSGSTPGTQEFLGSLQSATTRLWNELSVPEREHYAAMARDWSENSPPSHIQSRQLKSHYSMYHTTNSTSQNGLSNYPRPNNPGLSNAAVPDMWSPDCSSPGNSKGGWKSAGCNVCHIN